MPDYASELEFALEVAKIGGEVAGEHYQSDPRRSRKDDGTWVTEADLATESALRAHIASAWPTYNILGEEEGLTSAAGGEPQERAPTWVVDPIDGTNNFMNEIPVWAVLVALRVDERSVVGVVHAPALNETYVAAEGLGARFNGHRIAVDPVDSLEEATIFFGGERGFHRHGLETLRTQITHAAWRTRGFGDFWGHSLVARGAGHAMLEPDVSLWDVAALEIILEEAGGKLTHLDGSPFSGKGTCLSSNGALHDIIVAMATAVR
ncbi:MAG: inositol monophosphatase family protein [Actinomycetota bacterium]